MSTINGIDLFQRDNISQSCLQYLGPKELVLMQCLITKASHINALVFENCWQDLCRRRWLDARYSMRVANVKTWFGVYRLLSKRRCIPRGYFTDKHNVVLGNGMENGVGCWLLLGHTSDCKPRRVPSIVGSTMDSNFIREPDLLLSRKYVEVHLCIQNISCSSFAVLELSTDTIQVFRNTEEMSRQRVYCFDLRLLAHNGKKFEAPMDSSDCSSNSAAAASSGLDATCFQFGADQLLPNGSGSPYSIVIRNFDSIVISLSVCCPDDTGNEVDFLVQLAEIRILFSRCRPYELWSSYPSLRGSQSDDSETTGALSQSTRIQQSVVCSVYSEDRLWDFYVPMPRNAILLRKDVDNGFA